MNPYYQDDYITLYHADCLQHLDMLNQADVMVTDPPYGINWGVPERKGRKEIVSIANDKDTAARDKILKVWGGKPAVVFGAPHLPYPNDTKQILVWEKEMDSGVLGTVAGFRRNWEAIYLIGSFPKKPASKSSILKPGVASTRLARDVGHAHAKPISLMEGLIEQCPPGTIVDPFAGSGSTLRAAKNLGHQAIGFEIEEKYCEITAQRLAQETLGIF